MKNFTQILNLKQTSNTTPSKSIEVSAHLIDVAYSDVETVLKTLNTSLEGLSEIQSSGRLQKYGFNEVAALPYLAC